MTRPSAWNFWRTWAAEALFGESSELYLKLYDEGSIDSSFGGGFETIDGCAMLTCGGDSYVPEQVRSAVLAGAEAFSGLSEESFRRMKRSALWPPGQRAGFLRRHLLPGLCLSFQRF